MAEAFIGPRPEGYETRHLNDIPDDNRAENLVYGTSHDNKMDLVRNGRHYLANRTHCPKNHPYDEKNTYYPPRGGRGCRACSNEKSRRRYKKSRTEPGEPCTADGCDRVAMVAGLCNRCYVRVQRAAKRGAEWYERTCPHCGKTFEIRPDQPKRKYCTPECADEAARKQAHDRHARKVEAAAQAA